MRVIILAGYKRTSASDCPWLQPLDNKPLLERRLEEARALSNSRIVVLAGESAEQALRICPAIEFAQLVFDTNEDDATLMTNLRAALHTGTEPALVLPAELTFGDLTVARQLAQEVVRHGALAPFHVLQAVGQGGQLVNGGFPLFLTTRGCEMIRRTPDLAGLADPRLEFREVAVAATG